MLLLSVLIVIVLPSKVFIYTLNDFSLLELEPTNENEWATWQLWPCPCGLWGGPSNYFREKNFRARDGRGG